MFKFRIPLVAAPLLLLSLLIAQAATRSQGTGEWILVDPPGEGFSVRMPAKPDAQTEQNPMMGNNYQMRLYTSVDEASGLLYMVVMQEVPADVGTLQSSVRLESLMKGFKEGLGQSLDPVSSGKFALLPDRDLQLKGYIGRQYTLSVADKFGLVRAFDAHPRMYVLLVLGADEKNSSATRFFDSFEIKAAPAPVPKPITETKPS